MFTILYGDVTAVIGESGEQAAVLDRLQDYYCEPTCILRLAFFFKLGKKTKLTLK